MNNLNKYILGILDSINIQQYKKINVSLTEVCDIKNIINKRKRDSHKGTYGRVGVISGSKGMAGAAVLNLNSALRSGSGLVKAFIPNSIYSIVESMSIEALTYAFDEQNLSLKEVYNEIISFSDVIATGSGCTNLTSYKVILEYLLETATQPLIIDAEGINVLNLNKIINYKQDIVLTPHYGEMSRLLNKDISNVRENIIDNAKDFTKKYNVYLVLKGARTVLSCPDGRVYINTTGNPGMATAGSGDVLTGIIASFIGQKIEISKAIRTAIYIHGLAGDIGVKHIGEYSIVASDLIKYLPSAFKEINAD